MDDQSPSTDPVIRCLKEAREHLLSERIEKNSRALAITLTEVETALLWRHNDLCIKSGDKDPAWNYTHSEKSAVCSEEANSERVSKKFRFFRRLRSDDGRCGVWLMEAGKERCGDFFHGERQEMQVPGWSLENLCKSARYLDDTIEEITPEQAIAELYKGFPQGANVIMKHLRAEGIPFESPDRFFCHTCAKEVAHIDDFLFVYKGYYFCCDTCLREFKNGISSGCLLSSDEYNQRRAGQGDD